MMVVKSLITKRFRQKARHIALLCLAGCLLASCGGTDEGPDVSGIKVKLDTRRLDLDLARLDTAAPAAGLRTLAARYPDFLPFYLDTLMGFGIRGIYDDQSPGVRDHLRSFLTTKDYRGLFDTVARHFPDTKMIDEQLTKGFQHQLYYYPGARVPKIIYFISGLNNWSAITYGDEIVGVGLDMALGEKYPFYAAVGIPAYVAHNLTPEAMPVNVFRALYADHHPFRNEGRTLLDMMIQRGQEQYYLKRILPSLPDSLRFGFTASQMEWCMANESGIYNFLIKGNLLYETSWQKVLRYVTDGPQATGMPAESPGNVGTFIGWRIVEAYYKQHPKLKLEEMLAPMDAQRMLQDANYKPR